MIDSSLRQRPFFLAFTAISILFAGLSLPLWSQDAGNKNNRAGIFLRAEVWQIPQIDALDILEELRTNSNAAAVTSRLRERAKAGDKDVSLLTLPSVTTGSGQRCKIDSGLKEYLAGYVPDREGKTEVAKFSTYLDGTQLEADPIVEASGASIQIAVSFQHALEPAALRESTVIGPITGKELKIEIAEENLGKISTQTTLLDGQPKLLGTIPSLKDNSSILVFLTGEIVKLNGGS